MTVDVAPETPILLKPRQASQRLQISERSLWSLTSSGDIRCIRLGRSKRYRPVDLDTYVDGLAKRSAKR